MSIWTLYVIKMTFISPLSHNLKICVIFMTLSHNFNSCLDFCVLWCFLLLFLPLKCLHSYALSTFVRHNFS